MTPVENFLRSIQVTPSSGQLTSVSMSSTEREHLNQLVDSVKTILSSMQENIEKRDISAFYESLSELKFFIEYADELNKNWYILRACAGALTRLNNSLTIENASSVLQYYELKYGGRRILRNENWFEQQRWDFLDDLKMVNSEEALLRFFEKRTKKLNESFQVFKSELLIFLQSI